MIPFIVLLAFALLVVFWCISAYNGFIRGRNMVREAWSGIDTQLKRRYDLVPRLVESVKGYLGHERGLLQQIADLRAKSMGTVSVREKGAAETALTASLRQLFAVAEAYPDLKASQNMIEFQKALAEIEDQIQLARRYYNGAVRDFNIRVESFPSNLIAGIFNFRQAEFFELEEATERKAPDVKF